MSQTITRYWVSTIRNDYRTLDGVGNNHHQGGSIWAAHNAGSRLFTPVNGRWVEVVPVNPHRDERPEHNLSLAVDLVQTGRSYPIGDVRGTGIATIDGVQYRVCVSLSDLAPEELVVADNAWTPGRLLAPETVEA